MGGTQLRRILASTAVLGLAAGSACFAFGALVEVNRFVVRRYRLPILPEGATGRVRILHLSDIHLLPKQNIKTSFLRGLADLKPDLVINTGDNLGGANLISQLDYALETLWKFPGFYVLGSNDYFAPVRKSPLTYFGKDKVYAEQPLETDQLKKLFNHHNWQNLTDTKLIHRINDVNIEFRGTGDAKIRYDNYPAVFGPAQGDVSIGVIHAPYRRLLDPLTADGVSLILAGHTHGGQVCAPGFGALVANCDIPLKQASGLSSWTVNGKHSLLEVSSGLGTSPYAAYRFCCPPEAVVLDLEPSLI